MTILLISGAAVIAGLGIGIVWLDRKLRDPVLCWRVADEVAKREARKAISLYDAELRKTVAARIKNAERRGL